MNGSEKCLWCGSAAVAWCDAMIGYSAIEGAIVTDMEGDVHLCDAPLCSTHRRTTGHVCGADPETIDKCPEHFGREPGFEDWRERTTSEDAEARRREIRAVAARGQFATVSDRERQ